MATKVQTFIDKSGTAEIIKEGILESANPENFIKPAMIDWFTVETEKVVRSKKEFQNLKNKIQKKAKDLSGKTKSIRRYFEAYELTMEAREFFFGKLGEIDYIMVISINNQPTDIKISGKELKDLLFKGKKFGLSRNSSGLRFNQKGLAAIEAHALDILVGESGFELVSDKGGREIYFDSPGWLKKKLDEVKTIGERYHFNMDLTILEKNYQNQLTKRASFVINSVTGGVETGTVFSAVGKYGVDELEAKRSAAVNEGINYKGQMNIGYLTEVYVKYKHLYNQGKNHFPSRRFVSGEELFPIFQETRQGVDPWYSGGDYLESQIKSFLGSMPGLASFKSIKKEIDDLNYIFNLDDINQIKKEITEMFIQNRSTFDKGLESQINQQAKVLTETLANMKIV